MMNESRNKKETKGKVPQHEREKLRYKMRGGSYISEKKTSTPMCPFINKKGQSNDNERSRAMIPKDMQRKKRSKCPQGCLMNVT